jgi:BREX protein BrxB
MTADLTSRLNQILPTITDARFLSGSGIGNETAFYIFDYPPDQELRIRDHIDFLLEHLPRQKPGIRVKHLNVFDLIVGHLRTRKLLEKAFKLQKEKGSTFVRRQLEKILDPEKLKRVFVEEVRPDQRDLVLVSGVGSAYPMLRSHKLLNNLHSVMGRTPLVMFYPGRYDGQHLRLFGKLKNDNYYRAFKLGS